MSCKALDQAPFSDPRTTVQAAYGALSAIQGERPGTQLMAVAVLFKTLAETLGADISQLLNSAERLTTDDDTFFRREVKALREYVKGELK